MKDWIRFESGWRRFLHYLGERYASVFIVLHVSPNQLTISRFLVLGPATVVAYAHGSYLGPVIGLACLALYTLLDFADGAVAIRSGQITVVGGWLDACYDFLLQCCVLLGASLHLVFAGEAIGWLIVALWALMSQAALVYHTDIWSGVFNRREEFFEEYDAIEKRTLWQRLLVEVLVTRSTLSIVFLTQRYWVLLFTLAGRLDIMLAGIAVTQTARALALHFTVARALSPRKDEREVWRLLAKYLDKGYEVPAV